VFVLDHIAANIGDFHLRPRLLMSIACDMRLA
jgi:hypothetical protein